MIIIYYYYAIFLAENLFLDFIKSFSCLLYFKFQKTCKKTFN